MLDMDRRKLAEQIDSMVEQLAAISLALRAQSQSTDLPASLVDETQNGICHYCKLPLEDGKNNRGDHPRCYKEISRAIAAGQLTEELALAKGWIEPPRPAGRKPKQTPIKQMLAEIEAKSIADTIDSATKKVADRKSKYKSE